MAYVAQLIICMVGIFDCITMMVTSSGYDLVLKLSPPPHLKQMFQSESVGMYWFLTNAITCALFWFASINLSLHSVYSSLDTFRRQAVAPWFGIGMGVLFLSLVGNALDNQLAYSIAVIVTRIICVVFVWLGMERWDWDELQFDLNLDDDFYYDHPTVNCRVKENSEKQR